jgi:hypothetical protein
VPTVPEQAYIVPHHTINVEVSKNQFSIKVGTIFEAFEDSPRADRGGVSDL